MPSSALGIVFLLVFAVSQGVRDALFGNLFQSMDFLFIASLVFGTSSAFFTGYALVRQPADLRRIAASPVALAALNVTTMAAWLSFFSGLRYLEPAVVATLYNGVGPLTVLILGFVCDRTKTPLGRLETAVYFAVAAALGALIVVVLTGRSGMPATEMPVRIAALAIVVFGGATITFSHMIARWFNDRGAGAASIMGTRFLLAFVVATAAGSMCDERSTKLPLAESLFLAGTAFALITVPSFMLQLGVARTGALSANVFRALGPVFVFAVQQLDGRLAFSGPTLACVMVFCLCMIGASLARARRELDLFRI